MTRAGAAPPPTSGGDEFSADRAQSLLPLWLRAISIERIAGEAGVAVPTVYAMYRSKRAMLFALLDQADAQAHVAGLLRDLHATAGDPTHATAPAGFLYVPLLRQAGDIVEIARGAGCTNEDLLALAGRRTGAEDLRGQRPLTDAWDRAGVFARATPRRRRWISCGPSTGADHYRLFVVDRKWSAARYEAWLENTLERLLLR